MREMKFRAWSKKEKKFLTVGFSIIGEVTVFDMLKAHQLEIEDLNDIEVQQWTGLKDKNGRDIYEGDVVMRNDYIGQIVFNDGSFKWVGRQVNEKLHHLAYPITTSWYEYTVVNSIFENPEMLDAS
jgi:uncharacterized phage protein (TIGR01671 family)